MHNKKQRIPIFVATGVILLITLFFGLKPKGYRFVNQVNFTAKGLSFTNIGMIFSEKTLSSLDITDNFGIAVTATPYRSGKVLSRLICLIDAQGREVFTIDQWKSGVEASLWDGQGKRLLRTGASKVLLRDSLSFFAAGIKNGAIWIYCGNDSSFHQSKSTAHSKHSTGTLRLIAGFGPTGSNPWRGCIRQLALFTPKSDSTTAYLMKRMLSDTLTPQSVPHPDVKAHYIFSDLTGTTISNTLHSPWKLVVPRFPRFFRYEMPELIPTQISHFVGFLLDTIVNLIGFIPIGFALFSFFSTSSPLPKRPILCVVIVALSLSIFIETFQVFIPTRTSQLIDVVLNGLGGWLGAVAGRVASSK